MSRKAAVYRKPHLTLVNLKFRQRSKQTCRPQSPSYIVKENETYQFSHLYPPPTETLKKWPHPHPQASPPKERKTDRQRQRDRDRESEREKEREGEGERRGGSERERERKCATDVTMH